MVGHYKMSMTLPWAYYALRKKHVPSRKQIPKEVQNSFVMHNFCQCQQPSVKISKDRKGAFKKKVLGRKLREKLFQKLPNLVNARKPAECYKKQWKSHGCYFKDWTVKKYFKKFMKKSINNMLNNKINDIMVDEGEFEHIRDDGNYWGMQVRLLHTSLVRRLKRPLIFYCGQDRKDRWLLKEVSVILNSNFVAVDPKFKNSSGNYKWLQTVQETGKPKPKVQITEEDIVLFRKKDMDDDSDDEEESGEETPRKDMDDDSDDEEESGEETPRKPETSKKRPGESSKTPNPKKARITPQQKTDEKKVGDQANADNFKETPTESFVCSFCNKSFGSEVAVDSHINNVHGGKFTCPSCHKSLGSEAALKSHSRSKHDGK